MSTKNFPKGLKTEAVNQVTEQNHPVFEIARRLGVSTNSCTRYGSNSEHYM